jgi:hypothetical protein
MLGSSHICIRPSRKRKDNGIQAWTFPFETNDGIVQTASVRKTIGGLVQSAQATRINLDDVRQLSLSESPA